MCIRDSYYPDCETMTDIDYYYIDELQALGDIPPSLQNYIDYEAYGRDLDMGDVYKRQLMQVKNLCQLHTNFYFIKRMIII